MKKAVSLLKRLANLKREFVEPAGPISYSEEWQKIKDFELGFLKERFPDAYLAMIATFDQFETEDRARSKSDGLQLKRTKGKIPWAETEEGRWHAFACVTGWYGTMGRFPDASIALASAISELKAK